MRNQLASFSLTLGSLKFNSKSLGTIAFGLFLIGILVGIYAAIHLDFPNLSQVVTLPIFLAFVFPAFIIFKGIQEAEEITDCTER